MQQWGRYQVHELACSGEIQGPVLCTVQSWHVLEASCAEGGRPNVRRVAATRGMQACTHTVPHSLCSAVEGTGVSAGSTTSLLTKLESGTDREASETPVVQEVTQESAMQCKSRVHVDQKQRATNSRLTRASDVRRVGATAVC
jgi:hypothetical protein